MRLSNIMILVGLLVLMPSVTLAGNIELPLVAGRAAYWGEGNNDEDPNKFYGYDLTAAELAAIADGNGATGVSVQSASAATDDEGYYDLLAPGISLGFNTTNLAPDVDLTVTARAFSTLPTNATDYSYELDLGVVGPFFERWQELGGGELFHTWYTDVSRDTELVVANWRYESAIEDDLVWIGVHEIMSIWGSSPWLATAVSTLDLYELHVYGAAIPEPATVSLVVLGLGGAALLRRRRRR